MNQLQQLQYLDKYSRWNYEEGRRETWEESVTRASDFLRELSQNKLDESDYEMIYNAMLNMEAFCSMRLFAMAGEAGRRTHLSLYNCAALGIDSIDAFCEVMTLSLAGCGVGFSVENRFVSQLPVIPPKFNRTEKSMHVVPDTSEGWVGALREGLQHWFNGEDIEFDYSLIRPAGSVLMTKGGRACLTADTVVYKERKKSQSHNTLTIGELYQKMLDVATEGTRYFNRIKLRCMDEITGEITRNRVVDVVNNGIADVYEIVTETGYKIKATKDHRFYSNRGKYERLYNFSVGDFIGVNGTRLCERCGCSIKRGRRCSRCCQYKTCKTCGNECSKHSRECRACSNKTRLKPTALETTARQRKENKDFGNTKHACDWCGKTKGRFEVHHVDKNPHNNSWGNLRYLCPACHQRHHAIQNTFGNPYAHKYVSFDKIISIKYVGRENVYDIQMEKPNHNFVANGFISHNSGPQPLQELLDYSRKVIRENKGKQLTSIQVHDIVTKIAGCVVSGGVRRSATLSLFDETDTEMLHAKDNGWWKISPQRSNANNSVVINRNLTRDEISKYMHIMHNGGSAEPGLMFRLNVNRMNPTRRKDRNDWLYNPCFSPDTLIQTKKGVYRIKDLVGESVEVWNGKQWVVVDNFRVTNKDQPGVELELESGDTIVVTSYHSVILSDGSRKLAQDVEVGDELMPSRLATNSYEQTNFKTKVKKTSYRFLGGDVYCCTEPNRHEISLACGVQIGQCAEINLRPMQTCNLTQSIVRSNDTFKSLAQKVRIATIIGTIQSMATHFPGMRDKWRENCEEERLLGVSLDAQADNPSLLTEETMRRLRKIAIDTNRDYAKKLGINQSAAITCVKPGGNSSLLFDCSSGLHARWSKYYIRRMRINANSPIRKMLEQSGFKLYPENGQDYETANTMVVEFPIKSPDGAITNDDRTALDQLEWWRRNKVFWTNHNPSATISYAADELEQIIDWLYENQSIIGGLSFLPKDEHDYPLAPMEKITKRQYDKMVKELPEIDFDLLQQIEFEDRTTSASELACFGGTCLI